MIRDAITSAATIFFRIKTQSISNLTYLYDKNRTTTPVKEYVINVAIAAPNSPSFGIKRMLRVILITEDIPSDIAIRSVRLADVRT